ncbi:DUF2599 domain-containing protein [Sanguibacter sp. HDW7]|uniref:DUF2599 domain-containing protein n=1 Tax=Sanguibacter sp. HDW7 TaxID=2714931 RepID=UPI001F10C88F|nr:DUF2599 domain-containing protein [Sanguibacter sp. HDW7]
MTRAPRDDARRGARRHVPAVALLCAAVLAACGSDPGAPAVPLPTTPASTPPRTPTTTPPSSPSSEPVSAQVTDALGRTTTATLTGTGTGAAPKAALADGVVVVTATLDDGDALAVRVEGARWKSFPDGSATLTDGGAAPRVGGTDPSAQDDAGTRRVTARAEDDGRTLVVTVEPRSGAAASTAPPRPTTLTLSIAPRAVVSATWADDVEGGRSLQVDPTAFGRSGSTAALEAVRAELAAVGPEARTTVVDHQLRCHALGAPDKDTWNLEPWRPEVDYLAYLLARCNPT